MVSFVGHDKRACYVWLVLSSVHTEGVRVSGFGYCRACNVHTDHIRSVCVCGGGGGAGGGGRVPVNSSSQRSDPTKIEEIVMQAPARTIDVKEVGTTPMRIRQLVYTPQLALPVDVQNIIVTQTESGKTPAVET